MQAVRSGARCGGAVQSPKCPRSVVRADTVGKHRRSRLSTNPGNSVQVPGKGTICDLLSGYLKVRYRFCSFVLESIVEFVYPSVLLRCSLRILCHPNLILLGLRGESRSSKRVLRGQNRGLWSWRSAAFDH